LCSFLAKIDNQQPSGFDSKHGQTEVWGDITELCIMHLISQEKSTTKKSYLTWWNYVICVDNNYTEIPDNTQACAQQVGLDYKAIESCVHSNLGKQLMILSINRTDARGWNPGPGSPTVYVNDQCIYGFPPCQALDPSTNVVKQFICNLYTGTKPSGCSNTNSIQGSNLPIVEADGFA